MSKTAIAWVLLFGSGAILSFVEPLYGALIYLLDYYQHPPLRWWGRSMGDHRYSLIAACIWLAAYLFRGYSLLDRRILGRPQARWLLAFLAIALLVTPSAVSMERSRQYLWDLAKLTVLVFLILGTLRTRNQFRYFVLAMVIGSLLWSVDAYLDPDRKAGRLQGIGGPDCEHDNSAAAHLIVALPFMGVLLLSPNRWEKFLSFLTAPFAVNAVILCNSRGATLACLGAGAASLFLVRGKLRLQIGLLLFLGLAGALFLVDPDFIERQWTILEYERDGSAQGRIGAWYGALRLIADHPLGTGGGGFDVLSPVYIPEIVEAHAGQERAVHNTYLWVASDWGIPGLICFLGFILASLWELHRIRRATSDRWLVLHSLAVELGLIGFLIAAIFINRTYGEALYWLCALAGVLRNLQLEDAAVPKTAAVPEAPAAPESARTVSG